MKSLVLGGETPGFGRHLPCGEGLGSKGRNSKRKPPPGFFPRPPPIYGWLFPSEILLAGFLRVPRGSDYMTEERHPPVPCTQTA